MYMYMTKTQAMIVLTTNSKKSRKRVFFEAKAQTSAGENQIRHFTLELSLKYLPELISEIQPLSHPTSLYPHQPYSGQHSVWSHLDCYKQSSLSCKMQKKLACLYIQCERKLSVASSDVDSHTV